MKKYKIIVVGMLLICLAFILYFAYKYRVFNQSIHYANEFGFEDIISPNDYDQDGIDDYSDVVEGARNYIASKPKYKSKYYAGGYPDDQYGVCTDVIWNALLSAGYDLKTAIDLDIQNNPIDYPTITYPDSNIDFRRVSNLAIFFSKYATSLTTDITEIEQFMPGDIIIFKDHIGILSDKRNADGLPFVIHHDSLGARERNELDIYEIIAHYRITNPFIIE